MRFEVLIPEDRVQKRVRELGVEISNDLQSGAPVIVGVLTGAFVFMADLVKHLKMPAAIDFIKVKSYQNQSSTGVIRLLSDITVPVEGKDILLIEDILDTGRTLDFLIDHLNSKKPKSLRVCCFLDKDLPVKARDHVSYVGFKIPDRFVVGYGLDYNDQYRELPHVAALTE